MISFLCNAVRACGGGGTRKFSPGQNKNERGWFAYRRVRRRGNNCLDVHVYLMGASLFEREK